MNKHIKEIKSIIDLFASENYKTPWDDNLVSMIKNDKQFNHYFSHGNMDGSGGVYFLLYELVKKFKPKHVVELGNREGMGVLAVYAGFEENKKGKLTTIDIIDDLRFVPQHIKESKQVDFVFGNVLDENVVKHVENNGLIDLILFDTTHNYDQFKKEWDLYKPLLSDQAIILIDDLNYFKEYNMSKQKGFDELKIYENLSDFRIHSSGFGVLIFDKNKKSKTEIMEEMSDEEFWNNI